jgi:hypothetical protein
MVNAWWGVVLSVICPWTISMLAGKVSMLMSTCCGDLEASV